MKNKALGIAVPVLAAAAIVGTGFATWQFAGTGADIKIGANLQGYTSLGNIDIANSTLATLNLDSSADQGIRLVYEGGASGAVENQVAFSLEVTSDEPVTQSLALTTKLEFASGLGTYIDVTAVTYEDETSLENEVSGNRAETITVTDTLTTEGTSATETFVLTTCLTFAWAEDMEPDSVADWSTLKGVVDGLTGGTALTITYSVDFAD